MYCQPLTRPWFPSRHRGVTGGHPGGVSRAHGGDLGVTDAGGLQGGVWPALVLHSQQWVLRCLCWIGVGEGGESLISCEMSPGGPPRDPRPLLGGRSIRERVTLGEGQNSGSMS